MEPCRLRHRRGPRLRADGRAALSDVDAYLGELVRRLRAHADVVGAYAGGSYALGAYEPGRSDLDVAVVVASPLSRQAKEAVVAAVRHEALPCPARGLELVLYRLTAVREPTTEAAFELNLNTGATMAFRADFDPDGAEAHWFPIDRSILRQSGVAVYGPEPAEVFGELPRRRLAPVLVEALRWHAEGPARLDDAVLNACRAWRWAVDDVWSSKPAAGAWALAQADAPELVAQALEARHANAPLEPAAVRAFLGAVMTKLDDVAAREELPARS